MNKGRRHELKMLKYRKRLKQLNLTNEHHCYRTSGKPCSCYVCSTHKYKHNGVRKLEYKEIQFQLSA